MTRAKPGLCGGIREEIATTNRNLRSGRRQCHDKQHTHAYREWCGVLQGHIAHRTRVELPTSWLCHDAPSRLQAGWLGSPSTKHTHFGFSVLTDLTQLMLGPKKKEVSSCGHQENHRSGMQLAARAGTIGRPRICTAHDSSQMRKHKARTRRCDHDAAVAVVRTKHRTAPHHPAQGDMNKTGNEEEWDLRWNEMSCLQDLPARLQRRASA